MIILKDQDRQFIEVKFKNEQEIENLVSETSEYIFGPSSILIPKAKISTADGFGTIPDGFVVDIASRVWYVVEAELGSHDVWKHIAPQVTKQLIAAGQSKTHEVLIDILVQMVKQDPTIKAKFEDEQIKEIDIHKVLLQIFGKSPIIGMPIDIVSDDLKAWVATLKNAVRLWIVKKYVQFGAPEFVAYEIPDDCRPVIDTTDRHDYDVDVNELLKARLLSEGDELFMNYAPQGSKKILYKAIIGANGVLTVLKESFTSPSYAAMECMKSANTQRTTVNGWIVWKTKDGKTLAQLRTELLKARQTEATPRAK